jgi:hypothetical protein
MTSEPAPAIFHCCCCCWSSDAVNGYKQTWMAGGKSTPEFRELEKAMHGAPIAKTILPTPDPPADSGNDEAISCCWKGVGAWTRPLRRMPLDISVPFRARA